MLPSEAKKIKLEKLKRQKVKPHQKIANNFIENAIIKSNASALKTLFYLASILERAELDKVKDDRIVGIVLDTKEMLKYTNMTMPEIKRNILAMQQTAITFEDKEAGTITGMSLLPRYEIIHGKSKITLDLYGRVARMIIGVKSNYTYINTKTIMSLKKAHSMRMLGILNMIAGFDNEVAKRKRYDLDGLNEIFGTNYKRLIDVQRKVLAPVKQELDLSSKLSFLHEVNFDNLGKGRPKAVDITIDLIDNKGNLFTI
ncbi:MAG: replication initiation protein [Bacteroidales bacterium]|nr:replication initiation protein [Bacteroidales bacterium]